MRYIVKQKVFSLTDSYRILDERGNPAFEARGKLLSLTSEVRLSDMSGREVARINRKPLAWRTTYKISANGAKIATVRKRWSLFGEKLSIDSVAGTMKILGRAFSYEYEILRGGDRVARVSKTFFSLTDSYGVEIYDEANTPLLLACCLVIDQIYHESED